MSPSAQHEAASQFLQLLMCVLVLSAWDVVSSGFSRIVTKPAAENDFKHLKGRHEFVVVMTH